MRKIAILTFKGEMRKMGLNQGFMLIDKKKDAHRGLCRDFFGIGRPI